MEKAKSVAPPWQASHACYLAGQSHIDGADALAIEMERVWGVGRLRLLVSNELREKFDSQRLKLNMAIQTGGVADVQREADRMCNAWRALDAAARAAGAPEMWADAWEVGLPDGSVAVLVRSVTEAHKVVADGRGRAVYTLAEIANLLHYFPALAKAKATWPGATVTAVRREIADPLDALNDELPF